MSDRAIESASPLRGAAEIGLRLSLLAALAAAVIVVTVLRLGDPDGALTLARWPLPDICLIKRTFGIPCPGCGLTRSWVAAIHGDLRASLRFHAFGLPTLGYALAQGLWQSLWIALPRWRRRTAGLDGFLGVAGLVLVSLMILKWLFVLY